ncbi:MAG: YeeE/YedE thiosulfate transporter family protein [Hyphomicrobiaceae bacterium]
MSVLTAVLIGLASGVVFGFALEKSRVFEPGVIVGQMQLRNFLMLKIFLAAVITGLIVLAVLNGAFGVNLHLKPLLFRADLIGGLILGAGIALAGACPGTALAQIGAGYRDAWFVVLGGIAGAIAFGYFNEQIATILPDKGDVVAFDRLLGLPFWMVALALAAVLTAGLVVLERVTSWRDEVGADVDGLSLKVADADAGEPHRRPMPRGA